MTLRVPGHNQQCCSTEWQWLVNQVKGQSHQVQLNHIKGQSHQAQLNQVKGQSHQPQLTER